jgi:hypothetical protein
MHRVRLADYGFFVPLGTPASEGGQFRFVPLEGTPQAVQFFHVEVGAAIVLVIGAYHPALEDAVVARIVGALPVAEQIVAVIRDERLGWASASCPRAAEPELAAAAIAAVKVLGGWEDEFWSGPFTIVVDGAELSVEMIGPGPQWGARVAPS